MCRLLAIAVFLLAAGVALPSAACQFDADCSPGSKCRKNPGAIDGVCVGGLQPGNDHDRKPIRDPLDPNQTVGNTCSFDTDCGPGSRCAKSGGGSIYGTCVRR